MLYHTDMNKSDLTEQLAVACEEISHRVALKRLAVAESIGLNSTDYECFSALRGGGAMTAGQLAQITGLTTGAVTGVIDRLEQAGFAQRQADPGDRRRIIVAPLPAGLKKISALEMPLDQHFIDCNKSYTVAELHIILDWLTKTTAMIQNDTEHLAHIT